ncbi:MAG: hypothetical protein HPY53_16105 [Brevinematales bacterium]|nr:hypothetical protein [Brevinematales bacterium]
MKIVFLILFLNLFTFTFAFSQQSFSSAYQYLKKKPFMTEENINSLKKLSKSFSIDEKLEFYNNNYRNNALPCMLFNFILPCTGLGSFIYGDIFDGLITLISSGVLVGANIGKENFLLVIFPLMIIEGYSLISPWIVQSRQNSYLQKALDLDPKFISDSIFHIEILKIAF